MSARSFRFNHVIGIHLFEIKDHAQMIRPCLNIVCWGTSLQHVSVIDKKSATEVIQRFSELWRKHYGLLDLIVINSGEEFGGVFMHYQYSDEFCNAILKGLKKELSACNAFVEADRQSTFDHGIDLFHEITMPLCEDVCEILHVFVSEVEDAKEILIESSCDNQSRTANL